MSLLKMPTNSWYSQEAPPCRSMSKSLRDTEQVVAPTAGLPFASLSTVDTENDDPEVEASALPESDTW